MPRRLFVLRELRGPESNRRLEVMGLPRYLSSTPRYLTLDYLLSRRETRLSSTPRYIYYTCLKKHCNLNRPELAEDGLITRYCTARDCVGDIESGTFMRDLIANLMRFPRVLKRLHIRRFDAL